MFSALLMMLIGCLIVFRTFTHSMFWLIVPSSVQMSVMFTLIFAIHALISVKFPPLLQIAWLVFLFLFSLMIPFLAKSRVLRVWRQQSLSFLDRLVLTLEAGSSAKNAFREALDRSSPEFRVIFEKNPQLMTQNVRAEVVDIESLTFETHRVVEKFQALRRYKALQVKFGRKSSAALMPARAQAGFMCLMFLIVALGTWSLNAENDPRVFLFATILFLGGSFWVFNVGRRMKWKV